MAPGPLLIMTVIPSLQAVTALLVMESLPADTVSHSIPNLDILNLTLEMGTTPLLVDLPGP